MTDQTDDDNRMFDMGEDAQLGWDTYRDEQQLARDLSVAYKAFHAGYAAGQTSCPCDDGRINDCPGVQRDDAIRELQQRELHHFEEEQKRVEAQAKVERMRGEMQAMERQWHEEVKTLIDERDDARETLADLRRNLRLDQFRDGVMVVDLTTRKAMKWAASLGDLTDMLNDRDDEGVSS